jgi:hypothetical protein
MLALVLDPSTGTTVPSALDLFSDLPPARLILDLFGP